MYDFSVPLFSTDCDVINSVLLYMSEAPKDVLGKFIFLLTFANNFLPFYLLPDTKNLMVWGLIIFCKVIIVIG